MPGFCSFGRIEPCLSRRLPLERVGRRLTLGKRIGRGSRRAGRQRAGLEFLSICSCSFCSRSMRRRFSQPARRMSSRSASGPRPGDRGCRSRPSGLKLISWRLAGCCRYLAKSLTRLCDFSSMPITWTWLVDTGAAPLVAQHGRHDADRRHAFDIVAGDAADLLHMPVGVAHALHRAAFEDHVADDAADAACISLPKPAMTLLTMIIVTTPSITLMIDAKAM